MVIAIGYKVSSDKRSGIGLRSSRDFVCGGIMVWDILEKCATEKNIEGLNPTANS